MGKTRNSTTANRAKEKAESLAKQRRAFNAMPPALKSLAKRLRDQITRMTEKTLRAMWHIGEMINEAYSDKEKRYGDDPLLLLEAALGWTRGHVYKSLHFYRDFDEATLTWMLEKRMASGRPLSWNHVNQLLSVPKAEDRRRFIELTVDEDLTAEELADRIRRKLRPNEEKHAGGRPFKVPATLEKKLDNLDKVLQTVARNHQHIWAESKIGILASTLDTPPDKITPDIVSKLAHDLNQVESVLGQLGQLQAQLEDALEHARGVVQRQSRKQGEAEAAAIGSEDEEARPGRRVAVAV